MVEKVLLQMGYEKPESVKQFLCKEDNSLYNVWQIDYPNGTFVLKQAKSREVAINESFLCNTYSFAPKLYSTTQFAGADYILMEYIPGNDLTCCNRNDLISALNSLIDMQNRYWMGDDRIESYERSFESRLNRLKYLHDPRLEAAYHYYLDQYALLPRTLCHDDLLPFNVIVSDKRSVFIDWEVGGILPYPTSLARLLAHTEEEQNALFYMSKADKQFAINYYFDHFIKQQGISFSTYRRIIDLFLFYEYCEWVYIGNKYGNYNSDRYIKYQKMAIDTAISLGF